MTHLRKNIGRNVSSLGVVTARDTIEHRDNGAAQGISGDSHDGGIALKVRNQTMSGSVMINAADDEDQYKTEQTESLNAESADGSAAQRDLNGLADGESLTGLVGSTYICVGRALHTKHAYAAAHQSTDNECDSAACLNEESKDNSDSNNNDRDGFELRAQECGCTAPDNTGHVLHLIRAFVHLLDLAIVVEDVEDGKDCDAEHHKIPDHY